MPSHLLHTWARRLIGSMCHTIGPAQATNDHLLAFHSLQKGARIQLNDDFSKNNGALAKARAPH
jgi:hypothetical protein